MRGPQDPRRVANRTTRNAWRSAYGSIRARLSFASNATVGRLVPMRDDAWRFREAATRVARRELSDGQREFDSASLRPVPALDWWKHEQEQRAGGYRSCVLAYRDLRGPVAGAVLP